MTREAFIKKWLGNPEKQYNEQCKDEMRNDLDLINQRKMIIVGISHILYQLYIFPYIKITYSRKLNNNYELILGWLNIEVYIAV